MRDEFGAIYEEEEFENLFSNMGQPAYSPSKLALITMFQFVENLSDRQAADAVRSRIDWKYALGLELEDSGFDASVLSEFRARLIENNQAKILFDKLVNKLIEVKLIKQKGKQRTDATIVLANIHASSRLEYTSETMRYALNSLAKIEPEWTRKNVLEDWYKRYERRIEDFDIKQEERTKLKEQIGRDGYKLLDLVYSNYAPEYLRYLPAIDILRRIWIQQFFIEAGEVKYRQVPNSPPSRLMICSPYDEDARYSQKREKKWQGYQVHLTETIESDLPQLITDVETVLAPATDKEIVDLPYLFF